jgi:hypothetical protein
MTIVSRRAAGEASGSINVGAAAAITALILAAAMPPLTPRGRSRKR